MGSYCASANSKHCLRTYGLSRVEQVCARCSSTCRATASEGLYLRPGQNCDAILDRHASSKRSGADCRYRQNVSTDRASCRDLRWVVAA